MTCLFLIWDVQPGISPSQLEAYHWSGSPNTLFIPIALHLLFLWALLWVSLVVAHRCPGRIRVGIWAGLLFFTPWIVYQNLCAVLVIQPRRRVSLPLLLAAWVATSLLTAFWRPRWKQRFEHAIASAGTVLIFAGCFGAFMLCKLAWYGWHAQKLTRIAPLHRAEASASVQPHRVIWILFDELSYQQVFERRFAGLRLPNFDALAAQATNFTDVSPPDTHTDIVLPSLLSGVAFNDLRSESSGDVSLRRADSGRWQTFEARETIFRDALNAGYSTAVAGWYNPYCRIAASVLDHCYWTLNAPAPNRMIASGSVFSNTFVGLHELQYMVLTAAPARWQQAIDRRLHLPIDNRSENELHISDYQLLHDASLPLLQDPSAGFILLHLPVPHPFGIYDRRSGAFTSSHVSYLDNLALADRCLGEFRRTLETMGQWDSSTVVVMGDHSWRTGIWKPSLGWVKEDAAASNGGIYDPRPAYLVKLPSQTAPATVATLFPAVDTRKLFNALFSHRVTTPAELAAWAQEAK